MDTKLSKCLGLFIILALFLNDAGPGRQAQAIDLVGAERAAELLVQAKAALGGSELIDKATGFSASMTVRRQTGSPRKSNSKQKIVALFPTKFWNQTIDPYGNPYNNSKKYLEALNGERWWSKPPRVTFSSSQSPYLIKAGDYAKTREYHASMAQQQLTWYAFALLFRITPDGAIRVTSVGNMDIDGEKYDLLRITGLQDRFLRFMLLERFDERSINVALPPQTPVNLLLDQRTHLPSGLEFAGIGIANEVAGRGPGLIRSTGQDAPPRLIRILIRFLDHRVVDGILVPHRITTFLDGKVVEERTVTRLELNPKPNASLFDPPHDQLPNP